MRHPLTDDYRQGRERLLALAAELTEAELFERQEFAYDAAIRMRDRFQRQEIWERFGVDVREAIRTFSAQDPNEDPFQQLLFAKIVPNCKKLGLLDRNDKWLRRRFEEMNVIQFEDWEDTGEEYLKFELGADAPDPAAGG